MSIQSEIDRLTTIKANLKAAINGASGSTVGDVFGDYPGAITSGKAAIASAITEKGVATASDATFQQMAENVAAIETGPSLNTATVSFYVSRGGAMLSVIDSNMEYKRLETPQPWESPVEIEVNVPCIVTIDYYSTAFKESVTGQCTQIKSVKDVESGVTLSAYLVTGDTQVSVGY